MAQSNRVEARKYAAARQRIADGMWTVDAARGQVIGPSGHPIGRKPGVRRRHAGGRLLGRYVTIEIVFDGLKRDVAAHRVIWESVHGPIPVGLEINHRNGDKSDNRLANLELVTPKQNVSHAVRTGLSGHMILTPLAVTAMRYASAAGISTNDLAERYGVSRETVRMALRGAIWGGDHASGPIRTHRVMTWELVRSIRADHEAGMPPSEIGRKYDCPRRTLYRLLHNLTWREVPDDQMRPDDD